MQIEWFVYATSTSDLTFLLSSLLLPLYNVYFYSPAACGSWTGRGLRASRSFSLWLLSLSP